MTQRERRPWQPHEDDLLRAAVAKEDPSDTPSKWYAIAKHVPNRTNKDCRKRWFAKMASDVTKGGWSPEEDERLLKAIEKYGTRWSLVSSMVQTRNSDQCSKRWCDTLDPTIDRTSWTAESDQRLIDAVNEHGKVWTKIVKTYFPGRTGLAAKNRYNSITRFNSGRVHSVSHSSISPHAHYLLHGDSQPSISPSPPPNDMRHRRRTSSNLSYSDEEIYDYRGTDSPFEGTPNMPVNPLPDDSMSYSIPPFDPRQSPFQSQPMANPNGIPYISRRQMTMPNTGQPSVDISYNYQHRSSPLFLERDYMSSGDPMCQIPWVVGQM